MLGALVSKNHNIGQLFKQHGAKKEVQEPLSEFSQGSVRKHSCVITASRFIFTNLSENAQQNRYHKRMTIVDRKSPLPYRKNGCGYEMGIGFALSGIYHISEAIIDNVTKTDQFRVSSCDFEGLHRL